MKPTEIGAFEAKTHLSELLGKVEKGERYRITRRGKPVAMLVPLGEPTDSQSMAPLLSMIREKRAAYHFSREELHEFKESGRKH